MTTYSTLQVAQSVGVHRITLQRWMSAGKVKASQCLQFNGEKRWRWTEADLETVRKYKRLHYGERKGTKKGKK
jgi:predicted site-specific integrase-resolvase